MTLPHTLMKWDLFICHASEDKEDFVRPLARALQELRLRVWYDEFAITLGDSIRRSIERGLTESRYGLVILSPSFLGKEWSQRELDALFAKETDEDRVILPIWHKVGIKEVRQKSLLLADRRAISSAGGVDEVAKAVSLAIGNSSSLQNMPTEPEPALRSKNLSYPLANFKPERKAFEEFLTPSCSKPILIFHGASGSGKTSLLDDCLSQLGGGLGPIRIDLRNNAAGLADVFSRIGARLNWALLPKFIRAVAKLQPGRRIQVSRSWLLRIKDHISQALNAKEPEERDERRGILTEAWFNDVRSFDRLLLIVLDTYELASTEVKDWIQEDFLMQVTKAPQIRVLIAGQTVPEPLDWKHCVHTLPLKGIPEAAAWLPVIQAMNRRFPEGDTLDCLRGVCLALEGNPSQIMKILETLPRRSDQP